MRLILLTHSQRDRQRNSRIARDEFRLLKILKEAGLRVPAALHLCEAHHPPFLITAFADGQSSLDADPPKEISRALAAILYKIHSTNRDKYDLSFLPDLKIAVAGDLAARSPQPGPLQAAMQRALPRVEFNAPALLHGDFWPGNLLWDSGKLSAIIDWEDAMLGDPLADLGKSRLEVLWAFGPDAMKAYTARYLQMNRTLSAAALPFWDLWGASRLSHYASFAPEPDQISMMRSKYEAFIGAAIGRLGAL